MIASAASATIAKPATSAGAVEIESIFIVHGSNEEVKLAVLGFVREITDVPAKVLHLEPNQGRTVLEKFEAVGSRAGYAIVLLTDNDVGRAAGSDPNDEAPRARQNVVWEFGFFVGALGRRNVAVLRKGSTEIPSDLHGVVYIPYDEGGGWRLLLAKELKAANIPIDASKLL